LWIVAVVLKKWHTTKATGHFTGLQFIDEKGEAGGAKYSGLEKPS